MVPDVLDRVQFRTAGGRVSRERLSGTTGAADPCRPAPSRTRTAWGEEGNKTIRGMVFPTNAATLREISARWAFIAWVLTVGRTSPAAAPRAGQTAPKM